MDLSIIIPIYNVGEEELIRCFESVRRIENIRFECLLIDDGSKFETSVFCRTYAETHAHFCYHRKDNGGVSSARNLGMRLAKGEYICFVDADDEILPEVYSTNSLFHGPWDLIFTDLREINGAGCFHWKAFSSPGEICYEMAVERMITYGNLNGPYCKLIKRSFLEKSGVQFRTDMIQGEDAVFFCEILSKKPKMQYCNVISYQYYHSYAHGNRRFTREPVKCIQNAKQHNNAVVGCIELCSLPFECKKRISSVQKQKYIHELFCRALDSLEYGVFSKELHSIIVESVSEIRKEKNGMADIANNMKIALLKTSNWSILRCVERIRSFYYRMKHLR